MLEKLLREALKSEQKALENSTFIGSFSLKNNNKNAPDNEQLALKLLDILAEKKEVIGLKKFVDLLDKGARFKDTKPTPTDPEFYIYDEDLTKEQRQIIRLRRYLKAKKEYEIRANRHAEIQKQILRIEQSYNADRRGYLSFICDASHATNQADVLKTLSEANRFFFTRTHNFNLNYEDRKRHVYITGKSGSGKSSTIEKMIHQDLTRDYSKAGEFDKPAIVLIDPHGDLAKTCARFKVNYGNDRLVYIKPALSKKVIPTSNPLEIDLHSLSWDEKKNAAQALMDAFAETMKHGDKSGTFTLQMETVIIPCLTALLDDEGATLFDFMQFMDDEPPKKLLNMAQRVLTNPVQRDTLKNDFLKPTYNPTKLSIKTKLRNLLHDDHFYHYLVGKSTFDLKQLVNDRAFIVFDLSGLGKATNNIGRFVMAQLTMLAIDRSQIDIGRRSPIHLYIDEFQRFVSDSTEQIVTETRKYGLYGTFAQQSVGQKMTTDMKTAIINNSGIKIVGYNGLQSLSTMSKETGADLEELQNLGVGEFHIKAGKAESVAVKVPMVDKSAMMTWSEWRETLNIQKAKYYRPIFEEKSQKLATKTELDAGLSVDAERPHRSLKPQAELPPPPKKKLRTPPSGSF